MHGDVAPASRLRGGTRDLAATLQVERYHHGLRSPALPSFAAHRDSAAVKDVQSGVTFRCCRLPPALRASEMVLMREKLRSSSMRPGDCDGSSSVHVHVATSADRRSRIIRSSEMRSYSRYRSGRCPRWRANRRPRDAPSTVAGLSDSRPPPSSSRSSGVRTWMLPASPVPSALLKRAEGILDEAVRTDPVGAAQEDRLGRMDVHFTASAAGRAGRGDLSATRDLNVGSVDRDAASVSRSHDEALPLDATYRLQIERHTRASDQAAVVCC